jgi:hypothetical protein
VVLLARVAAGVIALAVLPTPCSAQSTEWWPGAAYDARVPTPASVLGHEIGAYWTEHLAMTDYLRRLEAAAPDRVKVFSAGRSHERREILLVALSDPANIARLEEIRQTVARLRDPRQTTEAQAREIARTTPAVAWMSFANDGNESAAFETAIQLAYHLAAGTDDTTRRVLQQVVTLVYPSHNPESHSRHVAWMKASATGNPDPAAQEHRGDWRMDTNNNHFQVDLNRDAAFLSQGESRVAVREIHRWNPVVFIDHHGSPDRFFFPPWARPVNPQVDAASRSWVEVYGRAIAAAFDRSGWTYFTRQVFDLHYPGYFDSYPALNGATGMTFETDGGGNKGLAYRLPDGRVTTLDDGVRRHFTGAMASLLTTADHREARLRDLYGFRASGMAEAAREKVKQFVLVPGKDQARTADLVELLLAHHIEVRRATAPFASTAAHDLVTDATGRRSFPSGACLISAAQPQKRLLRTLLDRETPLEEEFLAEVRKAKAYNDGVGESAAGDKAKLTTARDRYAAPAEDARPGEDDKGQPKGATAAHRHGSRRVRQGDRGRRPLPRRRCRGAPGRPVPVERGLPADEERSPGRPPRQGPAHRGRLRLRRGPRAAQRGTFRVGRAQRARPGGPLRRGRGFPDVPARGPPAAAERHPPRAQPGGEGRGLASPRARLPPTLEEERLQAGQHEQGCVRRAVQGEETPGRGAQDEGERGPHGHVQAEEHGQ